MVIAESQTAGAGRLDRRWDAPARAGLTLSVLLRPDQPLRPRGWAGCRCWPAWPLAEAVGRIAVVDAALKWPNDLLSGPRSDGEAAATGRSTASVAGVLAESVPASGRRDGRAPASYWASASTSTSGRRVADRRRSGRVPARPRWRLRAPPAPTGTRCCGRCCVRSPAGTAGGARRRGRRRQRPARGVPATCVTLGRNVAVALPGRRVVSGVGVRCGRRRPAGGRCRRTVTRARRRRRPARAVTSPTAAELRSMRREIDRFSGGEGGADPLRSAPTARTVTRRFVWDSPMIR